MPRIAVTPVLSIGEEEISESFVLASGPGGQNVNKVASAVQLRFDAAHSPSLDTDTRARLQVLSGRRLTKDGVLVIVAREHRTQERNRAEAREKLFDLIRRATERPKPRRETRPSKAKRRARVDTKTARGKLKRTRGKVNEE